jgi:hypothetical protein
VPTYEGRRYSKMKKKIRVKESQTDFSSIVGK